MGRGKKMRMSIHERVEIVSTLRYKNAGKKVDKDTSELCKKMLTGRRE